MSKQRTASERGTIGRPPRRIQMTRLGLGCYAIGGGYAGASEQTAAAVVDRALDAGWNVLDTAESYLASEERLGKILKGRRERLVLTTKAFPCEPYTYSNLEAAVDRSLRRLKTDRIDIFQLHAPEDWLLPIQRTPFDELADTLLRLQQTGRVLDIGVCNFPLADLIELHAHVPLYAIQNLYSMLDRGECADDLHLPVERELLPWASANAVRVLVYSPLSRGLLAENLDPQRVFEATDERHMFPRFQPSIYKHYVALSAKLAAWAHDHGRTLEQLAVAWTLQNPAVTVTLVGAKTPEQFEAVIGADSWHLNLNELTEVEEILRTLPRTAREAKMIHLDHVTPDALAAMRDRRHSSSTSETPSR